MSKNGNEERKKMVLAMEYIVRHCNHENCISAWLALGVPDGDITIGNLSDISEVDEGLLDYSDFSEIMGLFLRIMYYANSHGGLYCDGVTSDN